MNIEKLDKEVKELSKKISRNEGILTDFFISVFPDQAENIWNNNVDLRKRAKELLQMIENKEIEGCGKEYKNKDIEIKCEGHFYSWICTECQEKLNNCEKELRRIIG